MFVCKSCGYKSSKWMGKCTECNNWNSFEEVETKKSSSTHTQKRTSPLESTIYKINEVPSNKTLRYTTSSEELNRVLGGGVVPQSVVLVSGEPGIGKSTLMLQTALSLSVYGTVLYVCSEEALEQVHLRAERVKKHPLNTEDSLPSNLLLTSEYEIEKVETLIQKHNPLSVIVDSIQTVQSNELGSLAGKISHMSACTSLCCEWAQRYTLCVFLVAHVTKEGSIAGPKLVEHLVDTVLMFESSKNNVRFLYAQKNRYGATDEVGVLHMNSEGLSDISDTETFFLEKREGEVPPGICVAATYEGTRPFLVEIQSLVVSTGGQNRVFSDRIDARQIFRIAAVLERHLSLPMSEENIYINVAGGIRVQEPGFELALLLALYSSHTGLIVPKNICAIGEISLAGEIRSVENISQRCRQAIEHGFTTIIVPHQNIKAISEDFLQKLFPVKTVKEAINFITS